MNESLVVLKFVVAWSLGLSVSIVGISLAINLSLQLIKECFK